MNLGKQSGVSRVVATFYDICNNIWRVSRITESGIEEFSGKENSSEGIKAWENKQHKEFSNATNAFGHDINEG